MARASPSAWAEMPPTTSGGYSHDTTAMRTAGQRSPARVGATLAAAPRVGRCAGSPAQPPLGEVDLHLIGEGHHWRLWEALGAHVRTAPERAGNLVRGVGAERPDVAVVGDWNHWRIGTDRLTPQGGSGLWAGVVPEAGVGDRYKFAVEGVDGQVRLKADPDGPAVRAAAVDGQHRDGQHLRVG